MVPFGGIGRQVEIAEDRAQKQPGAEFPAHQIGVLALPSDTGRRRQRFLHDRSGIDENFDLGALPGCRDEPTRERLQPPLLITS
jgi:hypothetical protein